MNWRGKRWKNGKKTAGYMGLFLLFFYIQGSVAFGSDEKVRILLGISSLVVFIILGKFTHLTYKKAKELLHIQKLEAMIESAPIAYSVINDRGIILEANQYAKDKLGFETGKKITQFYKDKEKYDFLAKKVKENKEISGEVIQYKAKDNSLQRFCVNIMSFHGQEEVRIIIWAINVEESERQKEAKEKETNQLKDRFIINMSHEIRTPMNAIIGLSAVELQKNHSKEIQGSFSKINDSAKWLLAIINDILDFSMMEANEIQIEEDEFTLEEIIANVMETSSRRLINKRVEMLLRMDKEVPKQLFGDKTRLWQILKNVLDNSAKFTQYGTIILNIFPEEIKTGETILSFVIEDTGKGMSRQELQRMFVPFEQFNEKGSKADGTGLGMAIIKQLVEMMNGTIQVESQLNIGTKTKITIPFHLENETVTVGNEWNKSIFHGKKVLVVDDDATACEIMKELLQTAGMEATIIMEAKKVIPKVKEFIKEGNYFDLILLDHILDKGNGIDIAKRLKECDIGNAKILLVSAYTRLKRDDIMKEHVFTNIIEKPFTASDFLDNISDALCEVKTDEREVVKHLNFPDARVLVCEDNMINQDVIKGILSLYEIEPVIADNGKEGITLLEKERFDMVLMDMLMPVMDGHTAVLTIRNSNKPFKDVPIIAMTANSTKEECKRCKEEGMNGYISKPIDLESLYEELEKWLPAKVEEDIKTNNCKKEEKTEKAEESWETSWEVISLKEAEVDVFQGTKRFGGNYKLYKKTLNNFAKDTLKSEFPLFPITRKEGENEDFKRYIHTIKGITANLSLDTINKKIIQFEQTLKGGIPKEEDYRKIQEELTGLMKRIQTILKEDTLENENKETSGELGDIEIYHKLIKDLKEFLPLGKAEECETIMEQLLEKNWEGVKKEKLVEIYDAIDSYEYEKALELIDK